MILEKQSVWVLQDGRDFTVFADAAEQVRLTHTQAPWIVKDFDMRAATEARSWFLHYCPPFWLVHWLGPCGEVTGVDFAGAAS